MEYSKQSSKAIKNRLASSAIDARDNVVRYDMVCGLASIARPLKTGAERTAFVKHQKWNGGEMGIRGVTPDDNDLGVLLAFILLAEQQQPKPRLGKEIEGLLPKKNDQGATVENNLAEDTEVVTVRANYADVKRVRGITSESGTINKAIWNSLCNLSTITVDAKDGEQMAITHLIARAKGLNDSLIVTLSYRLTRALMADGKGSYAAIKMNTFNVIHKGAARILYVWLASWYGGAYGERTIGLNMLVEHVWGRKIQRMTLAELKDRRYAIRKALMSITAADCAWMVKTVEDNVIITRNRN